MATKTHRPDYLDEVNRGFDVFLWEVDPDNVFTFEGCHIIRNISPHGLGGILVFDASAPHFFGLTESRQYGMESVVERVVAFLEETYPDFYVITGMATSARPGTGSGQSLAYAHMHISLLPKSLTDTDNVHGLQVEHSGAPIRYTDFSFSDFSGQTHLSRPGALSLSFDSSDSPLMSFQRMNADKIGELLSARDHQGISYGTQWLMWKWDAGDKILWICPGIGYLPALGIGLKRSTDTPEIAKRDFDAFNQEVFRWLKIFLGQ